MAGRSAWPSRDPIRERGGLNLYSFCKNSYGKIDYLGNKVLLIIKELPPQLTPISVSETTEKDGQTDVSFDLSAGILTKDCSCGKVFTYDATIELSYWWVQGDPDAEKHEKIHVQLWQQAVDFINTFEIQKCMPDCYSGVMKKAYGTGLTLGLALNKQFDSDEYSNVDPSLPVQAAQQWSTFNQNFNNLFNSFSSCINNN